MMGRGIEGRLRSRNAARFALVFVTFVLPGGIVPGGSTGTEHGADVSPVKLPQTQRPAGLAEQLAQKFDPTFDIWDTEVLARSTLEQLRLLEQLVETPGKTDLERAGQLVAPDFSCRRLLPARFDEVFDDGRVTVHRAPASSGQVPAEPVDLYRGAAGLIQALETLSGSLGGARDPRLDLHLVRVNKSTEFFTTRLIVELTGRGAGHAAQLNSEWRARWTYPAGANAAPRLLTLESEDAEKITLRSDTRAMFTDCTASMMKQVPSYRDQVLPGIPHWLSRIGKSLDMRVFDRHGIAVGDVNGDGLEDLYVCDSGGLPNRLYLQNRDGTLSDFSAEAGVDWQDYSTSALIVDADNDGDQDLIVAMRPSLLILENDGSGKFTLRQRYHGGWDPISLAAADYDHDGLLDVIVVNHAPDPEGADFPVPIPYYDARNGGRNLLFRNRGNLEFEDVTEATGLGQDNSRFSFAAAWEDFDEDGDLDLYVANDFGPNNLYRNDGGRFVDVAGEAGVEDVAAGMSAAWADYNRDGLMDLYVGNMFSAAGNRLAFQPRFEQLNPGERAVQIQRMARGNTLFANRGDGRFADRSESAGVNRGRWAWSSKFIDLNNDGWQDLIVANGYITNDEADDL